MLLTAHAAVGAAIGASTENLPLIIILAFLSHFVLDILPHSDWGMWHDYEKDFKLKLKDYILVFCDILMVLIMSLYLWNNLGNNYIMIGIFAAILVDLVDNVPYIKDILRKLPLFSQIHRVHRKLHFQLSINHWIFGSLLQIIVVLICLGYLL